MAAAPGAGRQLVGALGQGSAFEDQHGYYLDPVSPDLPSFPKGWRERMVRLDWPDVRAYFVEANDVAVSKYVRGDARDMRWIREGLRSRLLSMPVIERRLASAPMLEGELQAARRRIAGHKRRLRLE